MYTYIFFDLDKHTIINNNNNNTHSFYVGKQTMRNICKTFKSFFKSVNKNSYTCYIKYLC